MFVPSLKNKIKAVFGKCFEESNHTHRSSFANLTNVVLSHKEDMHRLIKFLVY